MKKCILISAYLAVMLGLFGCQPNPNAAPAVYTLYFRSMSGEVTAVTFASPYDDPNMYRGPGK